MIRKSSVKKLGASTLQQMNQNRFSNGGKTKLQRVREGEEVALAPKKLGAFKKALLEKAGDKDGDAELDIGGAFLQPQGVIKNLRSTIVGSEILAEVTKSLGTNQEEARSFFKNSRGQSSKFKVPVNIQSGSLSEEVSTKFRARLQSSLSEFGKEFASTELSGLPFRGGKFRRSFQSVNREQIEGGIFEAFLNGVSNKPFDDTKINPNDTFDFRSGLGSAASKFGLPPDLISDAKRTFDTDSLASLTKKAGNTIVENIRGDLANSLLERNIKGSKSEIAARKKAVARKASGGGISGSDTVPALLTPGEFVLNKKAAANIGAANLDRMNKRGVQGFARGGFVGFKRMASGGSPGDTAAFDANLFEGISIAGGADRSAIKALVEAAKKEEKARQDLIKLQKEEANVLARMIKEVDSSATSEQALKRARDYLRIEYGELGIEIQVAAQESKKLSSTMRNTASFVGNAFRNVAAGTVGKLVPEGLKGKENRQDFASQSDKIAGAAQQFVFLGASVAAVTSQLGFLEQTTADAVTETAGFVGGIVGIGGTLAQIGTSFLAANSASVSNTLSENGNTTAVLTNTGAVDANTASQIKNNSAGTQLANKFGGLAISVLAVVTVAKFFEARARAAAKSLEKLRQSSLDAIAAGEAVNTTDVIIRFQQELDAVSSASANFRGGIIGAGTAVAAFAILVGTLSLPVTIVVAALAGLAAWLGIAEVNFNAESDARKRTAESLKTNIQNLQQMASSTKKLKDKFDQLSETNLEGRERVKARLDAQASGLFTSDQFDAAGKRSDETANRLGVSRAELLSMTPDEVEKTAGRKGIGAIEAREMSSNLEVDKRILKLGDEQLSTSVRGTRETTRLAREQLRFGDQQSIDDYNQAVKDEFIARREELRRQVEATPVNERAKFEKEQTKILDREEQAEREKGAKFLENDKLLGQEINLRKQLLIALIKEQQQLSRARVATEKLEQELNLINAEAIIDAGGVPDINVEVPDLEGGDAEVFQDIQKLRNSIQSLPAAARKQAEDAINKVEATQSTVSSSRLKLAEVDTTGLGIGASGQKIAEEAGLDLNAIQSLLPDQQSFDLFLANLQKANSDQRLTVEEINDLLQPIEQAAEVSKNTAIEGGKQAAILAKKQQAILKAEQAARQRNIDRLNELNNVLTEGAALLAEATGGSGAEARDAMSDQAAQQRLNLTQGARGGVGLQAGDIAQLRQAKQAAKASLILQTRLLKAAEAAGKFEKAAELQRDIDELQQTVTDAEAELTRLASGAGKLAVIQERLANAQKAREQGFAILEEFVVGGSKDRDALTRAASGIVAAVRTGTVQNQGEEQRKATFGLLDKLSDVLIGNTGLTGKEIKQELVFRDAIRLGFPPELARELATSTSIEEQQLAELKKLNQQRADAQAARFSTGGIVYRADGGSIFQPRGTDTVPAMLTPGEFVIRKSAVDKIGANNLQALNNGGGVVYRQQGGPIGAVNQQAGGNINITGANVFSNLLLRAFGSAETSDLKKALNTTTFSEDDIKKALQAHNKAKKSGSLGKLFLESGLGNVAAFTESALSQTRGLAPSIFSQLDGSRIQFSVNPNAQAKQTLSQLVANYTAGVKNDPNKMFANNLVRAFSGLDVLAQYERLIDPLNAPIAEAIDAGQVNAAANPPPNAPQGGSNQQKRENKKRAKAKNLRTMSPRDLQLLYFQLKQSDPRMDSTARNRRVAKLYKLQEQKRENEEIYGDRAEGKVFSPGARDRRNKRVEAFQEKQRKEEEERLKEERLQAKFAGTRAIIDENKRKSQEYRKMNTPIPGVGATLQELENIKEDVAIKKRVEEEVAGSAAAKRLAELQSENKRIKQKVYDEKVARKDKADKEAFDKRQAKFLAEQQKKVEDARKLYAKDAAKYGMEINSTQDLDKYLQLRTANLNRVRQQDEFRKAQGLGPNLDPDVELTDADIFKNDTENRASFWRGYLAYRSTTGFGGIQGNAPADLLSKEEEAAETFRLALDAVSLVPITKPGTAIVGAVGKRVIPKAVQQSAKKTVAKAANSKLAQNIKNSDTVEMLDDINNFRFPGGKKPPTGPAGNKFNVQRQTTYDEKVKQAEEIYYKSQQFQDDATNAARSMLNKGPNKLDSVNQLSPENITKIGQQQAKIGQTQVAKDTVENAYSPNNIIKISNTPENTAGRGVPTNQQPLIATRPSPQTLGPSPQRLRAQELRKNTDMGVSFRDSFIKNGLPEDIANKYTDAQLGVVAKRLMSVTRKEGQRKAAMLEEFQNLKDDVLFPIGRANGGGVPGGNDRVPAMLTPGEFVMSPEAVNKYGVGYMKSLNRGRVPGLRRGGIVGRGNIQYRQNGGGIADSGAMMSLDASNIQSVLETFNQQFQATLDTVVNQFSSLSNAMNNLAGVFGSGLTMTHTFTGDMSMAFKIDNLPELQQSIAKAITPTIVEQVKKVIDDQGKGFKAG